MESKQAAGKRERYLLLWGGLPEQTLYGLHGLVCVYTGVAVSILFFQDGGEAERMFVEDGVSTLGWMIDTGAASV